MNTYQNTPTTKTPPLFTKMPPLFFQNKNYFTKMPPLFYCQNGTFNIFVLLKHNIMCDILQYKICPVNLYSVYMFILHQTTTNLYIIRSSNCVLSICIYFVLFCFGDNKIYIAADQLAYSIAYFFFILHGITIFSRIPTS